jgi:hypothetical protein
MELEQWAEQSVTTEDLDNEVKKLMELEEDYEGKKKIYKEADSKYEEQRAKLLSILQASGKSKYYVDGIGTVSQAIKTSVKVPRSTEDKKAMLEYFRSLGEEVYYGYATVNSQTLNAYINQQRESDPSFKMPGAGEPTETAELRFRRTK